MESQGNVNRFEWTDTRITQLRTLVGLGLSGGQIANALGCTRNAVIGKMHRNGIKSTKTKGHQPGEPAPWKSTPKSRLTALLSNMAKAAPKPNMMTINARRTSDAARKQLALLAIEQPVEAPSEPPRTSGKSFMELAPHDCRWPYGDVGEEGFFFCGHEVVKGLSYCAGHCSIAYQPLSRNRKQYEVAS